MILSDAPALQGVACLWMHVVAAGVGGVGGAGGTLGGHRGFVSGARTRSGHEIGKAGCAVALQSLQVAIDEHPRQHVLAPEHPRAGRFSMSSWASSLSPSPLAAWKHGHFHKTWRRSASVAPQ